MVRHIFISLLTAAMLMWSVSVACADSSADYHKGITAFKAGSVAQAVKWMRKAATQGHAQAQYNLGWMYRNGQGVTQDYAQALTWYRKAADQGYANAQYNLGVMYGKGQGVRQDYAEEANWFRKGAKQGHARAQYNLGVMYYKGQGVIQDNITAYMWLNIAASKGIKSAVRNRDIVAKRMTAATIAEAQKRVRECLKSNYKRCD